MSQLVVATLAAATLSKGTGTRFVIYPGSTTVLPSVKRPFLIGSFVARRKLKNIAVASVPITLLALVMTCFVHCSALTSSTTSSFRTLASLHHRLSMASPTLRNTAITFKFVLNFCITSAPVVVAPFFRVKRSLSSTANSQTSAEAVAFIDLVVLCRSTSLLIPSRRVTVPATVTSLVLVQFLFTIGLESWSCRPRREWRLNYNCVDRLRKTGALLIAIQTIV